MTLLNAEKHSAKLGAPLLASQKENKYALHCIAESQV